VRSKLVWDPRHPEWVRCRAQNGNRPAARHAL